MKIKLTLFALLVIGSLSSFNFHPLNMSVADISYKDNRLHLKFKFFTDNLQNTLTKKCGRFVDLETDGYDSQTEKCLQSYIGPRFEMSVNNAPCKWVYKKGTLNRDVLLVEYESPLKPTKIKSIKIKNIVLFDVNLPEMKNIMNINLNNRMKMIEFDYDEAYRTGVYTQEIKY